MSAPRHRWLAADPERPRDHCIRCGLERHRRSGSWTTVYFFTDGREEALDRVPPCVAEPRQEAA